MMSERTMWFRTEFDFVLNFLNERMNSPLDFIPYLHITIIFWILIPTNQWRIYSGLQRRPHNSLDCFLVLFMVLNDIFNNISFTSRRLVLLYVENIQFYYTYWDAPLRCDVAIPWFSEDLVLIQFRRIFYKCIRFSYLMNFIHSFFWNFVIC